jgi:hypothetical protein
MKQLFTCTFLIFCCLLYFDIQSQPYYYTPNISNIFSLHGCGSCHGSSGELNVSYNGLFTGGSSCGQAVIPFNADGSPLVTKIDPAIPNCAGGNMPPLGNVSEANIAIIKEWINTGALHNSSSSCTDLVISAYLEGTSFNKYLEIYNGTGTTVDLSGYSIRIYSNGSATVSSTIPLSGILSDDSYLLIAHPSANLAGLNPDITNSQLNFNGNDAVALFNGTFNVDVFGQIGLDPGMNGWISGGCGTVDQTWVKTNLSADCPYGAFSGVSDFTTILASFYTCYPLNEDSALHTYIECNLPDAIPLPPLNYSCDSWLLPQFSLEVPTSGVYIYRIYDVPVGGIPIYSGLSFIGPALGTYYMALYEPSTGCEGERHEFAIALLPMPTVQVLGYICNLTNMTYSFMFSVSGIDIISVFDAVTITPILLNSSNEGILTGVPSSNNVNLRVTDSYCTFYYFFDAYYCPTPPCPTMTYPTGTTGMISVYDGQEYTLSALIGNPVSGSVVYWSNGQLGNSITLTANNPNFCQVLQYSFYADLWEIPSSCTPPADLWYNVTVYPNPFESAQLVINPTDPCSVSVEICTPISEYNITVLGYTVNGGLLQSGDTYTALAGEVSTVNFEIVVTDGNNVSESYFLNTVLDCPVVGMNNLEESLELLTINRLVLSSNSSDWELFYTVPESEMGMLDLIVYDATGSLQYRQQFDTSVLGQNRQLLQVPSVSPGLYLVQLSGSTQKTIYKWVKLY